jgi:hypothetical protein
LRSFQLPVRRGQTSAAPNKLGGTSLRLTNEGGLSVTTDADAGVVVTIYNHAKYFLLQKFIKERVLKCLR